MKVGTIVCASLLAAIAGSAVAAPPFVDGSLDANAGYQLKWTNVNATQFGNNVAVQGCDENNIGTPGAVTTGFEFKVPLAPLGYTSGSVRVFAFLGSGGHNNMSNQLLPGLPAGSSALGNPRLVDCANFAGNQFVTIASDTGTPTVDGTISLGEYPAFLATQTTRTNVGDNTDASGSTANGSELDGITGKIIGTDLYIAIAGNLASDFNRKIELFIDHTTGIGFNQLDATTLPNVDFGALQNMQFSSDPNTGGPGLKFDVGFDADAYITFGCGGPATFYPNVADLNAGVGAYLGCNAAGDGDGILDDCGSQGANGPYGIEIALYNANVGGVGATCPPANGDPDKATGSELDNLYYTVQGGRLYLFLGGNLQNTYNKIDIFLDVADGGQNTIGKNPVDNSTVANVDIDYGALGAGKLDGLTLESGFNADYWMTFTNGDDPVQNYGNAAVIRSDGKRVDGSGFAFDYGSYDGGLKFSNNPILFNGPDAVPAFGSGTNLYANWAPRLIGDYIFANPFGDPNTVATAGLIQMSINNSNVGGVGDFAIDPLDFCDAANVTTGLEVSIDLAEAGWDGFSPIRVAAFVNNGDHNFVSNQVVGGLPNGTGNLGPAPNFGAIAGNQFICLDCPCAADFNGDFFVDAIDYDQFISLWTVSDNLADFNRDCFVDAIDYDQFVAAWLTTCP